MLGTKGKKSSISPDCRLLRGIVTDQAVHVYWCKSGMNIMEVKKHFLFGLRTTPKDEIHAQNHYWP